MNILLIDSDPSAAAQLGDYLEVQGHSVDYAAGATLAVRLATAGHFHAIVIASQLPQLDGLKLCRKLRATVHRQPVVFLLDEEASVGAVVAAFDAGADGYLARPAACAEVLARLSALRRRRPRAHQEHVLRLADLELDVRTREVRRRGRRLALGPTGLRLLQALMEAGPRWLSHPELEEHLWGGDCENPCSANLRAQIYKLRCKVDRPFDTPLIQTKSQFGYRMIAPVEHAGR